MLYLLFRLGADRYALATNRVVEVLPAVRCKRIPHAPPAVAGLMNLRGASVPVVDLSALALGAPAVIRHNTRIILAQYDGAGQPRQLGLLAERVSDTRRIPEHAFIAPAVAAPGARYLGPVFAADDGIIQRVEVEELLTTELRTLLFPPAAP